MKKNRIAWTIAVLLTIFLVIWQRKTGPTYPLRGELELGGKNYSYSLPRSHAEPSPCPVRLQNLPENHMQAVLVFRRVGMDEPWTRVSMLPSAEGLLAEIPLQPKAGKVAYFIEVEQSGRKQSIGDERRPVVVRFRGSVPVWIVLPHILCIFLAFLYALVAGLKASMGLEGYLSAARIGILFLFLGGFLFGSLMQKYAFDVYWAGFPSGQDLTDNKTLIALLGWIVALVMNRRKPRPIWIVSAALLMLLVFLIPHSTFGSTLDYSTMQVKTG